MPDYKHIFIAFFIIAISAPCMSQHAVPTPVMGGKLLKDFIKTHIDYPETELNSNKQGTVKIEFKTNIEGNVIEYNVIQSVSPKLDSATVSLFNLVLWNPATSLGKPTIGSSEFEIKYNTKSYSKIVKRRGYKHIIFPTTPVDTSRLIYQQDQLDSLPEAILTPGTKSLNELVYSNITYPDAASQLGLTGKVELLFIIETNGLPSNIVTEKHLGGGCTEEAINIIKDIKWNPGVKDNMAVRTLYRISIDFKKGEKKDGYIPSQQGKGI